MFLNSLRLILRNKSTDFPNVTLVQGSGENPDPWEEIGPRDRLSGASQGGSHARSPAATKSRMSATAWVRVFSISAFPR